MTNLGIFFKKESEELAKKAGIFEAMTEKELWNDLMDWKCNIISTNQLKESLERWKK